jgi:hypothetical protein
MGIKSPKKSYRIGDRITAVVKFPKPIEKGTEVEILYALDANTERQPGMTYELRLCGVAAKNTKKVEVSGTVRVPLQPARYEVNVANLKFEDLNAPPIHISSPEIEIATYSMPSYPDSGDVKF